MKNERIVKFVSTAEFTNILSFIFYCIVIYYYFNDTGKLLEAFSEDKIRFIFVYIYKIPKLIHPNCPIYIKYTCSYILPTPSQLK